MLISVRSGISLTDKTSELFLKDAQANGIEFDEVPMQCFEEGVATVQIVPGRNVELEFESGGGKFAIDLGIVGGQRLVEFPVTAADGRIRIRSFVTQYGEDGKLLMPEKSMQIEYRVLKVERGSKKDDVLTFSGTRDEPSLDDLVTGRTLDFTHTLAKLSPAAFVIGKINLVLPGEAESILGKWVDQK